MGKTAFSEPNDKDRVPLQPLGRVDGGENQPLLIFVLAFYSADFGRIKGGIIDKGLEVTISCDQGLDLVEFLASFRIIVVIHLLEHRFVILHDQIELVRGGQG